MIPLLEEVRLLTGDTNSSEGYLKDHIYDWLLEKNGNSALDAAVEALEVILNQIALNPTEEESGEYRVVGPNVEALELRLIQLRGKKARKGKEPMLINAGRSSYQDIDSIFGD